jgi:hypothetical protein
MFFGLQFSREITSCSPYFSRSLANEPKKFFTLPARYLFARTCPESRLNQDRRVTLVFTLLSRAFTPYRACSGTGLDGVPNMRHPFLFRFSIFHFLQLFFYFPPSYFLFIRGTHPPETPVKDSGIPVFPVSFPEYPL